MRIGILPGQYYDTETGLHYNWHRYYDPSTGRYITPDPIGLAGGLNLYSYAGLNPINNVDPYGLWLSSGHSSLTTTAMGKLGFSKSHIAIAVSANINVDRISNFFNDADHYEPGGESTASMLVERDIQRAIDLKNLGMDKSAMEVLGGALHTIQDNWAHAKQNAGAREHLGSLDPDNPHKHFENFMEAYEDTSNALQRFLDGTTNNPCP